MTATITLERPAKDSDVAARYLETVRLIEELRYRLRVSIKAELDKNGIDLDAAQALMLHGVGDQALRHTDLRRGGLHHGSNASYNQAKLVARGFLEHRRADGDKREVRIRLTDSGRSVADVVESLLSRQAHLVGTAVTAGDLGAANLALGRIELVLVHQVSYQL